ncbi:MAG: ABC transporter permease [Bacteroidota bacterium]
MLRSYLKIALRNLKKNRLFSFINIAGMTLGMASFFVISIFVWDELKYDDYHPDKNRTFRIYNISEGDDGTTEQLPIVPPIFAPTLKADYPEVESTLRIMDTYGEVLLTIGDEKILESKAVYAESTIFDMLTIRLVEGNDQKALTEPNQVVVSQSFAKKHLNSVVLGETFKIQNEEFALVGVYEDIPEHSHLQTEMIMSLSSLFKYWNSERLNNWVWQQFFTYVKLKEEADANEFEAGLSAFSEKYAHPITKPIGFMYTPYIQAIDDIYLYSSNFQWEIAKRGNIYTVYALSAAALFIIIIVCVNFTNLSNARSINRLKEIAVRKVIGAQKKQLIFQFLSESVLLSVFSVVLAGLIAELSLPYLNEFTSKAIDSYFINAPLAVFFVFFFALAIGLLAGTYPAFFGSSLSSLNLFNKRFFGKGLSGQLFQRVAVVFQFSLSIFLIIAAIVVYEQLSFLRSKDLGFDKSQVILLPVNQKLRNDPERLNTIKNEWLSYPGIRFISYSFGLPGQIVSGDEIRNSENKTFPANHFMVDFAYIETLGLEIVAGRAFDKGHRTDASQAFILNETAVRNMGFGEPEEAIGQRVNWDMWNYDSVKQGEVIGVIKDFHFKSLKEAVTTTVLHIYPEAYQTMAIRVKPEAVKETLTFLREHWDDLGTERPFSYEFLDENLTDMYASEEQLSKMFTFFTVIGIFIACMGLFGLVSYTTAQKVKEIGVRKVLGADVFDILILINKRFLMLVFLGLCLAAPLAHYAAGRWLENFAYRIEFSPVIFLLATVVITLFAMVTVSYQSIKAASANPVRSLKEE